MFNFEIGMVQCGRLAYVCFPWHAGGRACRMNQKNNGGNNSYVAYVGYAGDVSLVTLGKTGKNSNSLNGIARFVCLG